MVVTDPALEIDFEGGSSTPNSPFFLLSPYFPASPPFQDIKDTLAR